MLRQLFAHTLRSFSWIVGLWVLFLIFTVISMFFRWDYLEYYLYSLRPAQDSNSFSLNPLHILLNVTYNFVAYNINYKTRLFRGLWPSASRSASLFNGELWLRVIVIATEEFSRYLRELFVVVFVSLWISENTGELPFLLSSDAFNLCRVSFSGASLAEGTTTTLNRLISHR